MNCIWLHTVSHKATIVNSCTVLLKEYVLHFSLLDLEKIKCDIFQNVFLYKKKGPVILVAATVYFIPTLSQTGFSRGIPLNLYSGVARFQPGPGHCLSLLRFFIVFLSYL
jgi:hypothetical protein